MLSCYLGISDFSTRGAGHFTVASADAMWFLQANEYKTRGGLRFHPFALGRNRTSIAGLEVRSFIH